VRAEGEEDKDFVAFVFCQYLATGFKTGDWGTATGTVIARTPQHASTYYHTKLPL